MQHLVVILKSIFTLGLITGHLTSSSVIRNDNGMGPMLHFIASADGKSYYVDSSIKRNWTEASDYCRANGMKLATITSNNQWTALLLAFDFQNFLVGHWTAGRESQELKQFRWNDTGSDVTGEYLDYTNMYDIPYQTCLAFSSLPDNTSTLYYRECFVGMRVLCETF